MGYNIKTVVDIAKQEVGYLEKITNSNLNEKTGNYGRGKYTKYHNYFDYYSANEKYAHYYDIPANGVSGWSL